MLYMIQLCYPAEQRDSLQAHIEQRGIAGYGEGVLIRGAWVAKSRDVFALVAAEEESRLEPLCSQWSQFGELRYQAVLDMEQIV